VTTAEASPYRWAILAVCVLGFMQTHVHRVGFAPLIPTFIADMGLSYAAAGTIMAAYFWTYALMQVPVGVLTDRLGPRRVMLACMGVMAVGALAFALAHTWTQSLLARCVVGAGAAATWLPGLRLIHEWFPLRERGLATGLFSAGGGAGGTAALLLLPVLAQHLGWRVGYALLALPVLITMAAVWALVGPTPRERDAAPTNQIAGAPGGFTASVRDVLTMPVLWPFNLYVLFSYGGYFALLTWLPTFLVKSEGFGQAGAGVVTALISGGTIVSVPLAGALSDRSGRRKPIFLVSQAMSVVVCLVFAYVVPGRGAAVAAVAAALTGLLLGGLITPFVMVTELVPPRLMGTASGVVNFFCFVGGLVVPVVLGYALDLTGSFRAAFAACAAFEAVALVIACFTRESGDRGVRASGSGASC
jgi:nitrate/nitrite transporter NarK